MLGFAGSSQQVKRPGDQGFSKRLIIHLLSSWSWSTGVILPRMNLTSSTHQLFSLVLPCALAFLPSQGT